MSFPQPGPDVPYPPSVPPYMPSVPAPKDRKPFYKRWWFIALAVVVVLGGIGNALGGGSRGSGRSAAGVVATPQGSADGSASAAAAASAAEAAARASAVVASQSAAAAQASASAAAAAAAEAAASASATAEKAAAATQTFSGKGDGVVKFKDFSGQGVIITLAHTGSSNFAVWSVDAQGSELDLLVNEIGKYSGAVPLNFDSEPAALKIKASGSWTATTMSVASAPRWDGAAPYAGKGDSVVIVKDVAEGLTPVKIANTGNSNFVVRAWSTSGGDLLVNEIGNYTGTTLIPSGTLLLEVKSSGNWTLAK